MRRRLGQLGLVLLAGAVVAGGAVAWRTEAVARQAGPAGPTAVGAPATPVLSVRRVPSAVVAPVAERRLRRDLGDVTALLPADSCLVVDGPAGSVEHRADAPMVPASAQKLLLATAAWDVLGPDHRFRTAAVATGPVVDGELRGDLVLVGGGDPLLATADYVERFRRQPQLFTPLTDLADALAAAGLRRVSGSIVGDDGRYDGEQYVAGWPPRYRDQNAVGPLSALSVNDGFARYPTSAAPSVALEPAADPAQAAAAALDGALEARGVAVGASPRSGTAPADAVELAAIESAPLEAVLAQLLLESDNNTAELLLKELGRAEGGEASTAGGAAVVSRVVGGGATVRDGSGLSLDNQVSCGLLVDLLDRPRSGPVLVDRLPVAGRSGTLDRRFAATPLEGALRAKTGSLNTVAALAGVVDDGDPPLRFALVVNVDAPARVPAAVAALQQAVGEVLVGWPRVPDLRAVGPQDGAG